MSDLFINSFKGKKVYSFVLNGKPCWIAIQIADLLGYTEKSRTIANCIQGEKFEKGIEYELLKGNELRKFKSIASELKDVLKRVPSLVIFYEDGLYGFLQYTEMPLGVEFRKWIRREVLPELREKGTYTLNSKWSNEEKIDVDNMEDKLKDKSKDDNIAMSLAKELIHSDEKIDDALDQFYNNGLSYNDFSDVRRKRSYEREDIELKFSSSIKRVKVGRDGFDLDKLERIKFATESAKMFKELLDRSGVSDSDKFLFLKAIYEEAGMELPFVDL